MSKHILLISQCFAPQNKIGAVRPTKLTKYLLRMGYQVTVLCGKDLSPVCDPLLARDLKQMTDVHMISEKSLLRWWNERKWSSIVSDQSVQKKANVPKERPWINALYLFLADRADAAFARACIRKIRKIGKRYDVVLSTYGPLSVHNVAYQAKRLGYAKKWIADFRDEAAVPYVWQKNRLKHYIEKVERNADAITAVSAGYLRVMGLVDKGHVIHNGFDQEDLMEFVISPKRVDKLTFIHCGQMYGKQRNLSPFFHALSELIQEGKINTDSIALVYAGRDTESFVAQAIEEGLASCLEGHGFLPRDESLRLQMTAHMLLLPAWNFHIRQGNIPGKLLEYMMLDMPVICCVSGDVPESEIAAIIRDTDIGICYEQANHERDYPRLKAYIQKAIKAFQNGEPMQFSPNRVAIEGFTCKGTAKKMENIIEEWT